MYSFEYNFYCCVKESEKNKRKTESGLKIELDGPSLIFLVHLLHLPEYHIASRATR